MTMGTQTDEVAIPGASLGDSASWRGHHMSVIRATGGIDSILRGASSTPSREDSNDGTLVSTPVPRPSPEASSSDAESVCASSSHYLRTSRTSLEEGRVPCGPVPSSDLPVGGLLTPGLFSSSSDVLGVWTYPLCDPRFAVRLACEAPDAGADRRLSVVPELYHGLLARHGHALPYGPGAPAGVADAGGALLGFPWPAHLTPSPGPGRPLGGMISSASSKTPPSPTLKFGMDRILSGEVCSQEAKRLCSPGVGSPCGSHIPPLVPLSYPGLMAPTPLRLFGHATSNQHPTSRPSGPGAHSSLAVGSASGKRKRSWSRAVFSNLQRKGLEKRFQLQKYITKPDRRQLAATLGLTDAQVKVWFQNRRMKWRHTKDSKPQQPSTTAQRLIESDEKPRELSPTISPC